MSNRKAVITGMGAITPLGKSVREYWDGLVAGRSGIRSITQFDPSVYDFPCTIAGEVPDFQPEDYIISKEARRLARSSQLALAAAQEAVRDAGLAETMPEPERAGVVYGTAIGGLERIVEEIEVMRTRGYKRVGPFSTSSSLPNASAFVIAREFQCLGPNMTISTACATSTQSIGEAANKIKLGLADVIIAGGTDAAIRDFTLAGFCQMRALPTSFNDCPEMASRPFDADREGFILSEGAGALIIESEEHATQRGARIYGEVLGFAASADGFHFAALDPEASGAIRAMRWALKASNVAPEDIDYINAHGSSTPTNDSTESRAIKAVFGERAYEIPISSTKSMIGHPFGAAGALEAIASILAMNHHCIPPTINYETPDPECDLDYVPNTARAHHVRTILSNSFGLGGQNACLVIGEYQ